MTDRTFLERMASRVVLPPYWDFRRVRPHAPERDAYPDLTHLSDQELTDLVRANALGVPMVLPLILAPASSPSDEYLLPYEPMITVSGKNIIAKRYVSKGRIRGSIKERWTQDDYDIKVEGILISRHGVYPSEEVSRLRQLCEAGQLIATSPLLELLGISRIVIESWELPHTSGEANQNYRLRCLSDDIYKLLLSKQDLSR